MTFILLQSIGLFHQDPQQRASSNIYHGMLVLVRRIFEGFAQKLTVVNLKMIRQNRLIQNNAAWEHQPFPATDPAVLDAMWRNWAIHEGLKR
jgi:hypothetical protein